MVVVGLCHRSQAKDILNANRDCVVLLNQITGSISTYIVNMSEPNSDSEDCKIGSDEHKDVVKLSAELEAAWKDGQ